MDKDITMITALENEKAMELINRMLSMKLETGKDVKCNLGEQEFTTEGSNTFEEMLINNSTAIFENFEKTREEILNTPQMNQVIESFKGAGRGKRQVDSSNESRLIASNIREQTLLFNQIMGKFDSLDFSNATIVLNWLNSTIKYINNHDLYLPLGMENSEYGNISNYIVKKLEEKGYYTQENNEIHSINDYYRKLISYQLNDLDKYQFFAYNYAIDSQEKEVNSENKRKEEETQEVINLRAQLQTIIQNKALLEMNLEILKMFENGEIDKKKNQTENYEIRRNRIKEKRNQLEIEKQSLNAKIGNSNPINLNEVENEEAMRFLNTIKASQEMNNYERLNEIEKEIEDLNQQEEKINFEQSKRIEKNQAQKEKINEKIIMLSQQEKELTEMLPETRKKRIKDQITQLESEKQSLLSQIDKNSNMNLSELTSNQMNPAEANQSMGFLSSLAALNEKNLRDQIANIDKKIADLKEQEENKESEKNTIPIPEIDKNSENDNLPDLPQPEADPTIEENSMEDYYQKLHSIAEEGNIFNDESKNRTYKTQYQPEQEIETENSTFENISNPKEETGINSEAVDEKSFSLPDLPTPVEDSLQESHIIQSIMKAPKRLIEKIRSTDFVKKLNHILQKLSEHKLATSFALVGVGLGIAVSTLVPNINDENQELDLKPIESEKISDSEEINNRTIEQQAPSTTEIKSEIEANVEANIETQNELQKKGLEEVINATRENIMDGTQDVYRTVADANHETNSVSVTEKYTPSWKTSEAGKFYDENSEVLTREQAEQLISEGKEVVVRYDNNNIPIGYAVVNNQLNDDNFAK